VRISTCTLGFIFCKPVLMLALIPVLILGWPDMGRAEEMKGPPEEKSAFALVPSGVEEEEGLSKPLLGTIRFFQEYISPTDGARCQFSPTCSAFGYGAISEQGPWLGMLMTTDRLMRCSYFTDPSVYPQLPNGRLADPVPADGGDE